MLLSCALMVLYKLSQCSGNPDSHYFPRGPLKFNYTVLLIFHFINIILFAFHNTPLSGAFCYRKEFRKKITKDYRVAEMELKHRSFNSKTTTIYIPIKPVSPLIPPPKHQGPISMPLISSWDILSIYSNLINPPSCPFQ